MRDTPEWRNWQTRLTQNQVLRSVGSSPTSGTNAKAAGKFEAFPPLFCIYFYARVFSAVPVTHRKQTPRRHKKPPPSRESSRPGGGFYTPSAQAEDYPQLRIGKNGERPSA